MSYREVQPNRFWFRDTDTGFVDLEAIVFMEIAKHTFKYWLMTLSNGQKFELNLTAGDAIFTALKKYRGSHV